MYVAFTVEKHYLPSSYLTTVADCTQLKPVKASSEVLNIVTDSYCFLNIADLKVPRSLVFAI